MTTAQTASPRSTADLVRSTRPLTVGTVALLALWGFGNLYELNEAIGALVHGPAPGALVGPLDAGSPFYYFVPASPLSLVLAVVLAVGTRATAVAVVTRSAAVLVGVAAVVTAVLVVGVNPQFRDSTADGLSGLLVVWLAGNTVRIVCVAAACWLLLSWRRIERTRPPDRDRRHPC